ncbi:hypothetical protein GH714_044020 [Hevea brasiliensis]|uniref:Uncharacterized protein n=1 Tax=Hevea brasiliensis TaxID=3981 RepID=A0A6A6K1I5_HEVBR|nr:hypothetical protein GH714_044020 [Hevea brasiliensis]
MVAGFCNSHQVSHFAAFFIDARAEISVAESRYGSRKRTTRPERERALFRFMFLGASRAGLVVRAAESRRGEAQPASPTFRGDGGPKAPRSRVCGRVRGSFCGAGFDNDPSAGSPTETLLRLLLPLNDKVQWTSRDVAGGEPPTSPRSEHFTGPFNRINQVAFLRDGVARTKPRRAEASRQAVGRSVTDWTFGLMEGVATPPPASHSASESTATFRGPRQPVRHAWSTDAATGFTSHPKQGAKRKRDSIAFEFRFRGSFCMRWVNNKRPPCKSTGEALGSATGPSGATGRHWALPRARGGNWEALGTATGPSGGATGRNWALPRARGATGGTGHCHGPVGGSNWEELGTATGPTGATGRHWALPRANRREQLGGTGHCHGPVGATGRNWALPRANRGSNWEALGTATACRGQLGGTGMPRARRGNWEALGTATGSSGATGSTGHCHGPVGGNWRNWALPRARRGVTPQIWSPEKSNSFPRGCLQREVQ